MKMYWEKDGTNQKEFLEDSVVGLKGSKQWLLSVIPDNESILDVGCGPGLVYQIFKEAKRNNEYLGIDIDKNYLKLAEQFFPGIQTRHTDCQFLPFDNNSVDHVIIWSVIEMLPDFRKALDEAYRVARKQIIIVTYIPLEDGPDYNAMGLSTPSEYIIRINKDKFYNYISPLGTITSGTLKHEMYDKYWWWIIKKT